MDEQFAVLYVQFVAFVLVALGVVSPLVLSGKIGLRKVLLFWLGSLALLTLACAHVMLGPCSCSLAQILQLSCSCLLYRPGNGVAAGEASLVVLTLLAIVAAMLQRRRAVTGS